MQTLVFVRHGEKPEAGLGLLTPQGLNRALKLPSFFTENFPRPDFIFAPNPAVQVTEIHGDGERYDTVRELLTIGPTAVEFSVPVNTQLPYNDSGLLADTLLAPQYREATIYVCWEHAMLVDFAKVMLKRFGHKETKLEWHNTDFDTIYVFIIDWSTEPPSLTFDVRAQDIGPLSEVLSG